MNDRETTLLDALTDTEPVIAGRKLRPFSAGTLQLCRKAGLRIVAGGAKDLSREELERELVVFFFIHEANLDEVREKVALPLEEFAAFIERYIFLFPARAFPALSAVISRELGAVEAANVDPQPRASHKGDTETAPPNI